MKYMLDTNICIYLIKKRPEGVLHTLHRRVRQGIGISSITLSELEFGVQLSQHVEQNSINLLRFLVEFDILSFDEAAAREYGKIRAVLQRSGKLIGNMDMLIAAHAKALGAVLVTNNEREFNRVDGLTTENWVQ
jgi:tRNA(fMet)-specific endonuclease VapC